MIVLRPILGSMNLGIPVDLAIASVVLAMITVLLIWHHLFDDYPTAQMVSNQPARILTRIAIWVVLGFALGIVWIKTYKILPFGANNMGLGYPTMGILAGQFSLLMPVVYFNTFFDKWPLVRKEAVNKSLDTSNTINN